MLQVQSYFAPCESQQEVGTNVGGELLVGRQSAAEQRAWLHVWLFYEILPKRLQTLTLSY
jgi:hypothetical protein